MSKKKIILLSISLVVLLVGIGLFTFFYRDYKKVKNNPDIIAKEEIGNVTKAIGKFMDLPDEVPTLATVTDKDKIKDQEFFKHAENGDKLLLYTRGGMAILFRPTTNRIIGITPLTVGDPNQPTQASKTQVLAQIPIAIYNGSSTVGLTNDIEQRLKVLPNIAVVAKEKANANTYKKNIVIDLTGTNTELAQKISYILEGTVGELPEGEIKPEASILIIAAR